MQISPSVIIKRWTLVFDNELDKRKITDINFTNTALYSAHI